MIVLCRHGATEGNERGVFLSRSDPPLSAAGRIQCEGVRDALRDVVLDRCVVSPARRAQESRSIIAPRVPYRIEEALREIDFGEWEGKTLSWLEVHDPQGVAERARDPVNFRPRGGESFADVAERVTPLVEELRGNATPTLVIAHRGSLGVIERLLRGQRLASRDVRPLEPGEFRAVRLS
ncbi:MAG: histidine phosphatase family protein [Candidatus Eremiobacteraeota bacterium]|nr:histidine phosphatase family protein [Candidatus Eremiobacteraeota bacterium]